MKNTIKMSLVAALTVAGLSTTASAGGLEEAIKGVSISGKMEVEYDWKEDEKNAWDLDWDVTAKIPVTDNVTAVFGAEGDTSTDIRKEDINGDKGADNVQVTKVYFQYANGPVVAMAGKMGMAGAPWFDDDRGNGLVAIYNAGPVAIAAAHFTGVNGRKDVAVSNRDIAAAALIAGNIGDSGINASLWYADASNLLTSYSLNVNGAIGPVNFDLRHTDVDLDGASTDNSLTKLVVSGDIDAISLRAGYAMTDKEGGIVSLDADIDDAETAFTLEQLSLSDKKDADAFLIGASVSFGDATLGIDFLDGEINGSTDIQETLISAEYGVAKNFAITGWYSMAEVGSADQDAASVALEYKF